MAECFTTEIHIGGAIRPRCVASLCQAIHEAHVERDWGCGNFSPQQTSDLLANCQVIHGVLVLRLCDDCACWGEFRELEEYLVRHRIPFNRFTEGKWEYGPQLVIYRPGCKLRIVETNTAREPIVPVTGLDRVLARLDSIRTNIVLRNEQAALQAIRSTQRLLKRILPDPIPPLPRLEVILSKPQPRKAASHDHRSAAARVASADNQPHRSPAATVA